MKKLLLIPDTHRPYHDKKAWKLLLKAAEAFKPDTIVTLGDFADFYSVSAHSKNPNRRRNLEYEVSDVLQGLSELDKLGATEKVFIAGNHEERLERYLMDRAPELFNVVRIPDLLGLKVRGWSYVPYRQDYKLGKLYLTHDVGSAGKTAVFTALNTYQHNITTGHTHRMAYIVEGNAAGEAHIGASFGWLGDAKKADYMHRIKASRDWALGFGVGYLAPNKNVYLVPVPIINYSCVVEGKHFKI